MSTPDNKKPRKPVNMRLSVLTLENAVVKVGASLQVLSLVEINTRVVARVLPQSSKQSLQDNRGIIELEIGVNEWGEFIASENEVNIKNNIQTLRKYYGDAIKEVRIKVVPHEQYKFVQGEMSEFRVEIGEEFDYLKENKSRMKISGIHRGLFDSVPTKRHNKLVNEAKNLQVTPQQRMLLNRTSRDLLIKKIIAPLVCSDTEKAALKRDSDHSDKWVGEASVEKIEKGNHPVWILTNTKSGDITGCGKERFDQKKDEQTEKITSTGKEILQLLKENPERSSEIVFNSLANQEKYTGLRDVLSTVTHKILYPKETRMSAKEIMDNAIIKLEELALTFDAKAFKEIHDLIKKIRLYLSKISEPVEDVPVKAESIDEENKLEVNIEETVEWIANFHERAEKQLQAYEELKLYYIADKGKSIHSDGVLDELNLLADILIKEKIPLKSMFEKIEADIIELGRPQQEDSRLELSEKLKKFYKKQLDVQQDMSLLIKTLEKVDDIAGTLTSIRKDIVELEKLAENVNDEEFTSKTKGSLQGIRACLPEIKKPATINMLIQKFDDLSEAEQLEVYGGIKEKIIEQHKAYQEKREEEESKLVGQLSKFLKSGGEIHLLPSKMKQRINVFKDALKSYKEAGNNYLAKNNLLGEGFQDCAPKELFEIEIKELVKKLQCCKNATKAQISAEKPYQKINKSEKDKKQILDLCKSELESWSSEDDDEKRFEDVTNLSDKLLNLTSDDLFSKTFAHIIMAKYLEPLNANLDVNAITSAVNSCGKIVDQKLGSRVDIIDHEIQLLNAILQTRYPEVNQNLETAEVKQNLETAEVKQNEDEDVKHNKIFHAASEVYEAIIEKIRPQVQDYLLETCKTEQAIPLKEIAVLFKECDAYEALSKLSDDKQMALLDKVNDKVESAVTDKMTTGGFMLFMFIMAAYTAYSAYNDVGSQSDAIAKLEPDDNGVLSFFVVLMQLCVDAWSTILSSDSVLPLERFAPKF